MSFIKDFKDFAFKGNLIDMAVGIIMGTAAAAIVKSFIDNIISPVIGMIFKVPDMSKLVYPKDAVEGAGIKYGSFLQNAMDFTIMAFVIFVALKIASSWMKKAEEEAEAKPAADIVLLTEIRDALKNR